MSRKKPDFSKILLGAIHRDGYSVQQLAKVTGISYPTFNRRLEDPGGWRIYELKAICKRVSFMPDEVDVIRKEMGFV